MESTTKCANCGAELNPEDRECQYCHTANPAHKETIEDRLRQAATLNDILYKKSVNWGLIATIAAVVGVISAIAGLFLYKYIVEAKTQKNLAPFYEKMKHWQYSETKNSDSIVDSRTAILYSDQSQSAIKDLSSSFDKRTVSLFVSERKSFLHNGVVEVDSSVYLAVPRDSVLPFMLKRSRYVLVRFDSDTSMNVKLDRYTDGSTVIDLEPADIILPRLRTSHRLTVIMTPAINPDSTVQITFTTAGFKW